MKIDTTDKHLIFLLERNARMPLKELADMLGVSREAVNYRIKRLKRSGIIDTFLAKLNFEKLGLTNYNIYLKLNNLDRTEYAKFVEELKKKKFITWIASLGGRFDLALEITTSGILNFDQQFFKLLDEHKNKISSYEISTRICQDTFGKKYLWPENSEKETKKPKTSPKVEKTDDLDRKIISVIACDARITIIELSQRINEAPSTISFRLKQLEERGLIEAYLTFSKIEDLGYSRFKVLVTVRNFSKEEEGRFLAFCKVHPNIYYYNKTIGGWNFEIEVDFKSPLEYQEFLIDLRSKFSDIIQDIESLSIFEEHKFGYWPY